jgi:hypothetical protein
LRFVPVLLALVVKRLAMPPTGAVAAAVMPAFVAG